MRTVAVLPVKRFARAKQRLGVSVADALRLELARAMVADVLAALRDTPQIERTLVVSCEPLIEPAALEHGARLVHDPHESGQSAAAALGIAHGLAEGFERVLCVPGDCPALDPRELEALLAGAGAGAVTGAEEGAASVAIVPDRHGTGTNALLLAPPGAIEPAFGPGSFERHLALAAAAGARCSVERVPSLLLDVDTRADLDALREMLGSHGARASRTRAVLAGRAADGGAPDARALQLGSRC